MHKKGNTFIIAIFFVTIIILIFAFIMATFIGEVNSLLYNIKLDMYSANKSAVIAVNKARTSLGQFSYAEKDFREYFKNVIMSNYNLNQNLENKDGLVQKVEIEDYAIYKKGQTDSITNSKANNNTIHTVIKVKIKPLILEDILSDVFIFYIHEDVPLNELIT